MCTFLSVYGDKLLLALVQHLSITGITLACSLVLAAVLTVASVYVPRGGDALVAFFSLVYSIPSLALFALLIPLTGLGLTTTVIVLTAYNQYQLLRTFLVGLRTVDPAVIEAARGMGMSTGGILVRVQIPLARRALVTGIKLAVVSTVGIATIAAFINAGGLGTVLIDGLRTMNVEKIVAGSVLCAVLALGLNGLLSWLERRMNASVSLTNAARIR